MIPLEQNYRSTNAILHAANDVISHNRERKEKNLWSELGEGEPVRVVEVEDEHAEARFVAAEIAALIEDGYEPAARSPSSTARTRRAACSRTCSSAQGIDYQVIGGAALLRARRDQGRDRLPAGDRQPVRRRLAAPDREPPAPRRRRHVARAARRRSPTARASRSGRRSAAPRRPGSRPRRCKAVRRSAIAARSRCMAAAHRARRSPS